MFEKKGQGLPLNTIIIAIIVVVVLVVIILIFTGQLGGTQEAINEGADCRAAGGTCTSQTLCESTPGTDCRDNLGCSGTCMVRG